MSAINFKREIADSFDHAIERASKALAAEGFGVLTRIDMHSKIREKTGKDIIPTAILGACNPNLAYEAYTANSDVASLMMALGDAKLTALAAEADGKIERALKNA